MAPTISRTAINQVPVFFAEGPPPLRAALVFRIGRVDESLPMLGMTHLVEHLALFPIGEQAYRYNGVVEGLRTVFWVLGTAQEIVKHFDQLTQSLRRLPLDRLWTEARVLRTEAAGKTPGLIDQMLRVRYGPKHWGLLRDEEQGLQHPDHIAVQQWANRWFTAGNAALWFSGSELPPITLNLPEGRRAELPELPRTRLTLPAWLSLPLSGIALSMVNVPSSSLVLLQQLLVRRARTRLRRDEGLSYDVSSSYIRLSRELSQVCLWADALPESAGPVTRGLLDVINELATQGPEPDELRAEVARMMSSMDQPGITLSLLDTAVTRELIGSEPFDPAQMARELKAATAESLARLLTVARETTIAIVPPEVEIPDRRFHAVPSWYQRWVS